MTAPARPASPQRRRALADGHLQPEDARTVPRYVLLLPLWVALLVGLLLLADGAQWGHQVADGSFVLFPFLAGWSCWDRGRRAAGDERRSWLLFATAMWTWTAGGVVWCSYELLVGRHPFPTAADVLFVAYAFPAVVGLLWLPAPASSWLVRSRTLLDALVLSLSVLFVSWSTVLSRTYEAPVDGDFERVVLVGLPVADLLLIALVLVAAVRVPAGRRGSFTVLGAGFLLLAVCDSTYVSLAVAGSYVPGTVLDAGWAVAFSLVAYAPYAGELHAQVRHRMTVAQQLLPYGVLLVAVLVGLFQGVSPTRSPFLFALALLLTVVVAARQVVVVLQKTRLADELATRAARADDALGSEREFLRAVMRNLHAGVVACDADGILTFSNAAAAAMHDDPARSRIEHWRSDLWTADARRPLREEEIPLLRALAGDDVTDVEFVLRAPGRAARVVSASGRCLRDGSGAVAGAVVAMHDVTERKEVERVLRDQAFKDGLTGLGNRQQFKADVEALLERGQDLAVLLLDLDDFKHINDSLGHHAGDLCLVRTAVRLLGAVPVEGGVCRLGGDEFVVVLPCALPATAVQVAAAVLAAVAEPTTLAGTEVQPSASLGIVTSAPGLSSVSELLKAADLAMYLAKSLGKGRYALYEEHLSEVALQRLSLENDLRKALRNGELTLVYQPIVELRTGRMSAVEALLRWTHPVRGPVSPVEFIPVAEQTGLIVEIGEWVLREACAQLLLWDGEGGSAQLRVTVNVSTRQLERRSLLTALDDCLSAGLDPARLILEVTETALTVDSATADETLHAVRNRGVQLAVDDFGTGYSSLSRLRSAPVSRLKIDRSFVAEIGGADADVPIVTATVAMAHGLGLGIVAEGIETQEQLEYLRSAGCPEGQGYLLARPLPPDAVVALCGERRPWDALIAARTPVPTPSADAFPQLFELAVDERVDLEQLLRPLLTELRKATGHDIAYLTRVVDDEQEVCFAEPSAGPVREGVVVPWGESLCKRALEQGPRHSDDAAADYPGVEAVTALGLKSCVVEPVRRDDGQLFGTLCGASTSSRSVTDADSATLRMFARLVEQKLASCGGRQEAPLAGGVEREEQSVPTSSGSPLAARQERALALWEQTSLARRREAAGQLAEAGRAPEEDLVLQHLAHVQAALEAQLRLQKAVPRAHARLRRVVLVDDDAVVRQVLAALLDEHDNLLVVGAADSGCAAIGVVIAEQPDILVLDYELGDFTASEIVDDLRRFSPGTRILLHSARPDAHQLGQRLNVDRVVLKGEELEALADALAALVG